MHDHQFYRASASSFHVSQDNGETGRDSFGAGYVENDVSLFPIVACRHSNRDRLHSTNYTQKRIGEE